MLKYDTLEQAQMRLNQVVITDETNQPWFISNVRGRDHAIILELRQLPLPEYLTKEEKSPSIIKEVNQDDPNLNFRLFDIGYINDKISNTAVWPQRTTARQQRQGLTPDLLNISSRTMYGSGFVEMMKGVYPSREEAMQMVNDKWSSVAITTDFAIGRSPSHSALRMLLFRGREVGLALGSKAKSFVLNEEDAYLGDLLEEQGLPFEVDAVESLD